MGTEERRVEELEHHLHEIERQVRKARGETLDVTPWDYNIPSGSELRLMREECDLSREEVGEMIGYSDNTIAQVETASQPPGREFIRKSLILYKREWPR